MFNEADLKYAEQFLGEDEQVKKDGIAEIQRFLSENPQIGLDPKDIRTITIFLRGCKYRLDRTKKKITNYHQIRVERDEWFANRNPHATEIAQLLTIGVLLPLLRKDVDNRSIIIVRTAAHNPKNHSQNDVFKVGFMIMDYIMSIDDLSSIYGNRVIFDLKGMTLNHAMQMTPLIIRRAVAAWEANPINMKKLEFVNAPFHVNIVLDVFRSFMTKKMKERIFVRRGLPEFNSSDFLPVELGGNGESYAQLAAHWQNVVVKNYDFFMQN